MTRELYEEVHDHRVAKENVADLDVGHLLGEASPVELLYCDPPWRATMALFASIRERQTGEESTNISFGEMLTVFYDIIEEHVDGHVFLWGSPGDEKLLQMMNYACVNVTSWTCINNQSGSECLFVYGGTDHDYNFSADLEGMNSLDAANIALDIVVEEGMDILDPTCGQGWTAQQAVQRNCTFYGNEWNEVRADETIERIREYESL